MLTLSASVTSEESSSRINSRINKGMDGFAPCSGGGCLLFACETGFGAFGGDGEVAHYGVIANNVRMRVGGAALGHRGKLVFASSRWV